MFAAIGIAKETWPETFRRPFQKQSQKQIQIQIQIQIHWCLTTPVHRAKCVPPSEAREKARSQFRMAGYPTVSMLASQALSASTWLMSNNAFETTARRKASSTPIMMPLSVIS